MVRITFREFGAWGIMLNPVFPFTPHANVDLFILEEATNVVLGGSMQMRPAGTYQRNQDGRFVMVPNW